MPRHDRPCRGCPHRPARLGRGPVGVIGGVGVGLLTALFATTAVAQMPEPPPFLPVSLHARRLVQAAMGQTAPPRGMVLPSSSQSGEPLVPLIVQAFGGAAALRQAGLPARELSSSFAAVELPPSQLPQLWQVPGLERVDGARVLHPRLDISVPLIGADKMHDLGVYGSGVLLAIVDTGIDFRHADFRNPDGSSRIAFLVDAQTPRGRMHPELPDSGGMAVFTKADIDAVLTAEAMKQQPSMPITELDLSGHGTHVAGIAAGNGKATGNGLPAGRYIGMAPQAALCVVKATKDDQNFTDMDIFTGVSFCFACADALNMPVVANLSLGSAGGPHDGSSALEMALDELIEGRPGHAVAVAAGNSGSDDIHASNRLFNGTDEIPIKVDAGTIGGSDQSSVSLEVYFDTREAQTPYGPGTIDLELVSPGNKVLRSSAGQANQGTFPGEGTALIDNSDTTVGLRGALIVINGESAGSSVKSGEWTLRIIGSTLRYDLWMVDNSTDLTVTLLRHLDPDGYVEIPAAAHNVVSVGAMRSRASWPRVDGHMVDLGAELLRVAPFSSGGPTSDGRFAPDILAPGEFVISSLSTAATPDNPISVYFSPDDPNLLIADDGVHGVLRGTSQSTPHVSGAVALLFNLDPTLTATHVRELLRTTGDIDSSLSSYGPRRGFGTLNMQTMLLSLRGSPPMILDAGRSDVGSNYDAIPPDVGEAVITVTPRDVRNVPMGPGLLVDIESDFGDFSGPTVDTGFGRYERTLLAHAPRGTRATVSVSVGGTPLERTVSISFIGDSSELGTPFQIAGCALAGPTGAKSAPAGRGPLGLMLLGLAALALRRRLAKGLGGAAVALYMLITLLGGCSPAPPAQGDTAAPLRAVAKSAGATPVRRYPIGGDYYWEGGEALNNPSVIVHLRQQEAEIFDGDTLIARSSVCSGRQSHKTPAGQYIVQEKIPEHISNRYGDYVDETGRIVQANIDTSDEAQPAGTIFRGTKMPYFLRIVGGIGLHAGPLPGYPDSHGCIRLPPFIAQRLFNAISVGTPVTVEE